MKRFFLTCSVMIGLAPVAFGDTVILMEDFESYADTDAMQAAWVSTDPSVSRIAGNVENPSAFPSGGQGAEHLGGAVNIWNGLNAGNALHPTATQSVRLEVDIWHDHTQGNKRLSMGLRGPAVNLIELGGWNANSCDPTVAGCNTGTPDPLGPGFIPLAGRQMAHRLQLFDGFNPPLLMQPNWQIFELPLELDTNANGTTSLFEVGSAWHTYTATIRPNSITLSLDLYRDGVRNISTTPGDGTAGVPDAEATWTVNSNAAGYSDIRFGGPSGVTSPGGSLIFDNIKLSLIDVVAPPTINADFNGNNVVDAADYVIWRDNLGTGTLQSQGDADGNGVVNQDDYTHWKATFGNAVPGAGGGDNLASGVNVPEPASAMLCIVAALAALVVGRRR